MTVFATVKRKWRKESKREIEEYIVQVQKKSIHGLKGGVKSKAIVLLKVVDA